MLNREKAAAHTPRAAYYTSPDYAMDQVEAWNKLYVAIANSDEYKATAKDPVPNVGLGRQWITTPTY